MLDTRTECREVIQVNTRKRLRNKSSHVREGMEESGLFNREVDGELPGRKKQIFQGVMRKSGSFRANILILAEFIPSIAVGLVSHPDKKIWIYSERAPSIIQSMMPAAVSWIGMREAVQIAHRDELDRIIIQGSPAFVNALLESSLASIDKALLCIIIKAVRTRGLSGLKSFIGKWYRVDHASIGGITTSSWLIGFGKNHNKDILYPALEKIITTYGLRRRFIDTLKVAVGGTVVDPPTEEIPELISIDDVLKKTKFKLPSVLSRTGWTLRS